MKKCLNIFSQPPRFSAKIRYPPSPDGAIPPFLRKGSKNCREAATTTKSLEEAADPLSESKHNLSTQPAAAGGHNPRGEAPSTFPSEPSRRQACQKAAPFTLPHSRADGYGAISESGGECPGLLWDGQERRRGDGWGGFPDPGGMWGPDHHPRW